MARKELCTLTNSKKLGENKGKFFLVTRALNSPGSSLPHTRQLLGVSILESSEVQGWQSFFLSFPISVLQTTNPT